MQDRPTALELVAAVRAYLQQEVVQAAADPRQRFRALIAVNVLGIVERELVGEDARLFAEWRRLVELDPDGEDASMPSSLDHLRVDIEARTRQLCDRIRAGAADAGPWRRVVLDYARWSVREKLLVSNPRYLARIEGTTQH